MADRRSGRRPDRCDRRMARTARATRRLRATVARRAPVHGLAGDIAADEPGSAIDRHDGNGDVDRSHLGQALAETVLELATTTDDNDDDDDDVDEDATLTTSSSTHHSRSESDTAGVSRPQLGRRLAGGCSHPALSVIWVRERPLSFEGWSRGSTEHGSRGLQPDIRTLDAALHRHPVHGPARRSVSVARSRGRRLRATSSLDGSAVDAVFHRGHRVGRPLGTAPDR